MARQQAVEALLVQPGQRKQIRRVANGLLRVTVSSPSFLCGCLIQRNLSTSLSAVSESTMPYGSTTSCRRATGAVRCVDTVVPWASRYALRPHTCRTSSAARGLWKCTYVSPPGSTADTIWHEHEQRLHLGGRARCHGGGRRGSRRERIEHVQQRRGQQRAKLLGVAAREGQPVRKELARVLGGGPALRREAMVGASTA